MSEFDQFRDTYAAQIDDAVRFSGQPHDFFIRVKAAYLLECIARALPDRKPIRLLDVGCGHGVIHRHLREASLQIEITGIDVAGAVIEAARTLNPGVHYDVYDGTALPYGTATFDVAVAITVVHHVPPEQWSAFIGEMRRVVRPGGLVAIFEHNPHNPLTRRIVRNCPIDENAVLLPSRQLQDLARGSGLEEIERRFILFTPFATRAFQRLDRWLGWLPLGAQYYVTGRAPL